MGDRPRHSTTTPVRPEEATLRCSGGQCDAITSLKVLCVLSCLRGAGDGSDWKGVCQTGTAQSPIDLPGKNGEQGGMCAGAAVYGRG